MKGEERGEGLTGVVFIAVDEEEVEEERPGRERLRKVAGV